MKIRNVATIIAVLFVFGISLYLSYVTGINLFLVLAQPPVPPAWQNIIGSIVSIMGTLAEPIIVFAICLCTVKASGSFLLSVASAYTQRGDKLGGTEA